MNNKAISPVVSIALLLVVTVSAVVGFQNFVGEFNSGIFSDIETKDTTSGKIRVETIIGNEVYLYATNNASLNTFKISDSKTGATMCEYSDGLKSDSDGLVGYWSFDDYNVTHVFDKSEFGNDGEIKGNPSLNNGFFNIGLILDGIDDSIFIVNQDEFNFASNGSLSISTYVKPNDVSTNYLFSHTNRFNNVNGYMVYLTSSICVNIWDNLIAYTRCSNGVKVNEWNFITINIDNINNLIQIYLNGEIVGEKDISNFNTTLSSYNNIEIGNRNDVETNQYRFNGSIDEVRIYNRSLSENEINNLYHFNKAKLDLSKGVNTLQTNCNLSKGNTYNLLAFTNSQKIEYKFLAK